MALCYSYSVLCFDMTQVICINYTFTGLFEGIITENVSEMYDIVPEQTI